MPKQVGSIGLAESGRLIAALWHDLVVFDPDTGALTQLAKLTDEPGTNRLNDGKVGPDGAFWVGTIVLSKPRRPVGSLYRLTGDGRVERKATGYGVSNGLAFSPDGRTMFHSDSFSEALSVDRWTLDPATGEIGSRTRIAALDEKTGFPDGAACDAEGHYWSAGVFGGRLNRFTATGTLIEKSPRAGAGPDHAVLLRPGPADAGAHFVARKLGRRKNRAESEVGLAVCRPCADSGNPHWANAGIVTHRWSTRRRSRAAQSLYADSHLPMRPQSRQSYQFPAHARAAPRASHRRPRHGLHHDLSGG